MNQKNIDNEVQPDDDILKNINIQLSFLHDKFKVYEAVSTIEEEKFIEVNSNEMEKYE